MQSLSILGVSLPFPGAIPLDDSVHIPVLSRPILELGNPQPGEFWVDGTAGGGGHSRLIAEHLGASGRLLALDRDPAAILRLKENLPAHGKAHHASYDTLPQLLEELNWPLVDGILLDLGLSSDQLADQDRGFSFQTHGDLDMRFDPTQGEAAWEWLERVDESQLADAIFEFGEERFSRRIARRIVEQRKISPLRKADELRELIYRCVPKGAGRSQRHGRIDPATRTFQALRIVVNRELDILTNALQLLPGCLKIGGKLLIISFHSLEDRRVKHAFREDQRLEVITRRPIQADEDEVGINPRSRSAKLRIARRILPAEPILAPKRHN
ncbi:MAG: 16S rRNA (cytosine(1402)-N(4))-methyltransferase RsmH [Planctomycetales bacterium]|nr:16S rRNA (cytosine(1402)-N(4))-methyltransferase RsmH [Planctomycetales bacterium]